MNRQTAAAAVVLALAPATAAFAQQAPAQATKRDYVVNELSGFSVVLVVGEMQKGRSSTDNLPEGAARALKEMSGFLPYKGYRVLDAQWTSCCSPKASTTVSGRLQGTFDFIVDGKSIPRQIDYGFSITASTSMSNVPMRFVLTDDGGRRTARTADQRALERQRQDVQAEVETVEAQIQETRRRVQAGVVAESEVRLLQNRHASLRRRLADLTADLESAAHDGGRPIIDSSFTMNAGETVVVGTSKLGGEQALIALVTAVRKGTARE
jgi:hypothetical protein